MKRVANIFNMVAAVCLMVCLLSTTAFADASAEINVSLSGILQTLTDGSENQGDGWSFDESSRTITIENSAILYSADTVECAWNIENNGRINGGKFTGTVTNKGTIEGGVFTGVVENTGSITDGEFFGSITTTGVGSETGGSIPLDTTGLVNLTPTPEMVAIGKENSISLVPNDGENYKVPSSITLTIDGSPANSEYYTYSDGFLTIREGCITSLSQKVAISGAAVERACITTEELPDGEVGKTYTFQLKARGARPFTWEMTGYLPEGLTFDRQTGTISGTPMEARTFESINFKVSDETGDFHSKELSLTIEEKENTWYRLNIPEDLKEKLIIGSADPASQSVRVDDAGQYWIMEGDSALTFLPATGYVFLEQLQITFDEDCGSAQTSDGVHYQLTGVAGDGKITVKIVQWQEYQIISGGNQTYTGAGDLRPIIANGDISKFISLHLITNVGDTSRELSNGVDYYVEADAENRTSITLEEYVLRTLDEGVYHLQIIFSNGNAFTKFIVANSALNEPVDLPKTGDDSHPLLWLGLMLASVTGICACGAARSKRK